MTVMHIPRAARIAVLALALCGCFGSQSMVKRLVPPDADRFARAYLAMIGRGAFDSAATYLDSRINRDSARVAFAAIRPLLAGWTVDTVHVVGVNVNTVIRAGGRETRSADLTYELHSRDGWLLAGVATVRDSDRVRVEAFSTYRLPRPLEAINAFHLWGRSPGHYAWLLLAAANVVLSLGACIAILRARAMPKRYRWAFVALLGVGQLSLNWTTGAYVAKPITVLLFGAACSKAGPAAPWIVSFSLPLGALAALERYWRWRRRGTNGTMPTASEPEPAA